MSSEDALGFDMEQGCQSFGSDGVLEVIVSSGDTLFLGLGAVGCFECLVKRPLPPVPIPTTGGEKIEEHPASPSRPSSPMNFMPL